MPSAVLMWTIEVAGDLLQQEQGHLLEWTKNHIPGWHAAVLGPVDDWFVEAGRSRRLVHQFSPSLRGVALPSLRREKKKIVQLFRARRALMRVGDEFLDL